MVRRKKPIMNIYTFVISGLTYALALLTGTFGGYLGKLDRLYDDDAHVGFEMPYLRAALGLATAVETILAAAGVYLILRDFTGSSVNGWLGAAAALIIRISLTGWFAEKLYALKYGSASSFGSSW
jgi:hypothetical protein